MAITYTWLIPKNGLYTLNTEGQTDVVVQALYEVSGTDGTHTTDTNNMAQFTYVSGNPFVPFNQLTEAQVLTWAKDAIGIDRIAQIEKQIANILDRMANPPVRPKPTPAPWSTT
jgi:hypothetical protein